jgi:DnaB helicase-like protein
MTDRLSGNFLNELAKLCLTSKDTAEVIKTHLSYAFIKGQEYKQLFKYIFDYLGAHDKLPTMGMISQELPQTSEMLGILSQVRETSVVDSRQQILTSFEKYIKKNRCLQLNEELKELYNKQEHEKAFELQMTESKAIYDFSLSSQLHSRIFADFDKRQAERAGRDFSTVKYPIGIPAFDYHTYGGIELKTSLLGVGRSGAGKSTLLRHIGNRLAWAGLSGVHFQAEGGKEEVQNAYDSMWTGVPIHDIKKGELNGKDIDLIERARKAFMAHCGEIYVISYEQFDTASIAMARQQLIELRKTVDIKWAMFDYLELFDPGDGRRYGTNGEGERSRKAAVAKKIVNIATEFDMFTATVTQASDIEKKDWDNPNFVITRSDISNLKATIDPFSWVLSLNQTMDENDNDIMRLYEDKLRHYPIKSWEAVYHVAQDRAMGRFVNLAETNARFWDPVKHCVIKNVPKTK